MGDGARAVFPIDCLGLWSYQPRPQVSSAGLRRLLRLSSPFGCRQDFNKSLNVVIYPTITPLQSGFMHKVIHRKSTLQASGRPCSTGAAPRAQSAFGAAKAVRAIESPTLRAEEQILSNMIKNPDPSRSNIPVQGRKSQRIARDVLNLESIAARARQEGEWSLQI